MIDPWNSDPPWIGDDPLASADMDNGARAIDLAEAQQLLASPDDRSPLTRQGDGLVDSAGRRYPIVARRPWLLPHRALDFVDSNQVRVPLEATRRDALAQYLHLTGVKASGWSANSEPDDPWFLRHMRRAADLLAPAAGLVLDVGCDNPQLSRRLFPQGVRYLGLEPALATAQGFSIAGMAEFLPFADDVFDGVAMLTSLDHVLDHHAAIDEAWRVLSPGGSLFLATLIWEDRAELCRDNIHFHHFRDFEIRGALARFGIRAARRYGWKGDRHRHVLYVHAAKPQRSE